MKKFQFFLCIILCSLALNSCNHCPKQADPLPYYPIAGDLYDFGKFDVGTYWVYQNDSTLSTDSVAVASIKETKIYPGGYYDDCKKSIPSMVFDERQEFLSTNQNGFSQIMLWGTGQFQLFGMSSNLPPYSPLLSLGYGESNNHNQYITYYEFLDSMKVLNQVLYDIGLTQTGSSQLDNMDSANYYFARNYGLVKKLVFESSGHIQSWSLTRSKIIQ